MCVLGPLGGDGLVVRTVMYLSCALSVLLSVCLPYVADQYQSCMVLFHLLHLEADQPSSAVDSKNSICLKSV